MNKLAWIAAALISGAGFAGAAAAESFTFVNQGVPGYTVSAQGAGGARMEASAYKLLTTVTYKSGAIEKYDFQCVSWSTPREMTSFSAICNGGDSANKYSVIANCLPSDKGGDMCWGVIVGIEGKRAGKHGTWTSMSGSGSTVGQGALDD